MIYLIGLLLIGQLDHFGFDAITSPQTVGIPFSVVIYALNSSGQPVSYNGSARISVPNVSYPVKPDTIIYFNGSSSWSGSLMVSLAGDTITIQCEGGGVTGLSNQFQVLPGSPRRLLTVLPGQSYAPGNQSGRVGNVTSQQAGATFGVATYLTDQWCNIITASNDSCRSITSDVFAPAQYFRLNNGYHNYNYSFRTAGTQYIYCNDIDVPSIKRDTSSALYVYPGQYSKILVILPGDTLLPGDTTTTDLNTPGKSGTASDQYILEDFEIRAYAVDSMWNQTNTTGDEISLTGSTGFSNPPNQYLSNGTAVFSANFSLSGEKSIWATDLGAGFTSYENRVEVTARAADFNIMVNPDTISPGQDAAIMVTVIDRNSLPIEAKLVSFSVVSGHGYIISPYDNVYTNALGECTSHFTATTGFFNEIDTIQVTADGYAESTVCYVVIPDSSVMEGDIVAYPNPFGRIGSNTTQFIYYLQQNCNAILAVFDPFGNLVHRQDILPGNNGGRVGINILAWNGYNDKNRRVASGVYYVVVKGYLHTSVFLEKRLKVGVIW